MSELYKKAVYMYPPSRYLDYKWALFGLVLCLVINIYDINIPAKHISVTLPIAQTVTLYKNTSLKPERRSRFGKDGK